MTLKKDIISHLEEIAIYLELKGGNPFKIAAYLKASQNIEIDVRSLSEIEDFKSIEGVGDGTNDIIVAFIETGTSDVLDTLKQEVPEELIHLLKLPGLGGKRLAKLHEELDVVDLISLKHVCESGAVEKLKGFGKKTTENILFAIDQVNTQSERLPLAIMLPLAERVLEYLNGIDSVIKCSIAGSLRRMKETIKDIDFIIATDSPSHVKESLLLIDNITDVIATGETKISITVKELDYMINIDFRLVKIAEYATTLHHFTGSKEHNIAMRQRAKERGEKINEYGVVNAETNSVTRFKTEKEFFNHFDLNYIPPELRIDGTELNAFEKQVDQ